MKIYIALLAVVMVACVSDAYAGGLSSHNLGLQSQKISKAERRKQFESNDIKVPNAPKNIKINWVEELDLNEYQQQYWQKIHEENQLKKQEIIGQIKKLHQQLEDLRVAEEQQIRSSLDEKQQIKMDKIMHRNNRNTHGNKNMQKPSRKRMRTYGKINTSE